LQPAPADAIMSRRGAPWRGLALAWTTVVVYGILALIRLLSATPMGVAWTFVIAGQSGQAL
jgi:hypothetical protein